MAKSSEEISKYNTTGGKPDTNLSNDTLHLGGIPAEDFATHKYVQDYHGAKELLLKEYIDAQDERKLQQAKSYTDVAIQNQDFSNFAELTDVQALDRKLTNELEVGLNNQKNYTDGKVQALANDVNENFEDVGQAISSLNTTTRDLFTSVSNGKRNVAAAITDKGVSTASDATFDTMATNIRKIPTSGGEPDPYYVNTGDGTAESNDIMLGKTAYVKGEKVYGSHIDTGIDTSDATATSYDIVAGKTAYVDGEKVMGVLDLSGQVPTYNSADGVEKIYGGGTGDYSIGSMTGIENWGISPHSAEVKGLLYNSNTKDVVALVRFNHIAYAGITPYTKLKFDYLYSDVAAQHQEINLENIVDDTAIQMLQQYDDYDTDDLTTYQCRVVGMTELNTLNPYIAVLYWGRTAKKEAILVLLPLIEVHTPQEGGGTIITWEIDTTNIKYYPLVESTSSVRWDYMCAKVEENGTRIFVGDDEGEYGLEGFMIKIDIDDLSILNMYKTVIRTSQYTGNMDYIQYISVDKCIVFNGGTGTGIAFFDSNYNYIKTEYFYGEQVHFTSDLKYAIGKNGNIYSIAIDWYNYSMYPTLIGTCSEFSYVDNLRLLGDKFVIVYKQNKNTEIYEFKPTAQQKLTLLENVYTGISISNSNSSISNSNTFSTPNILFSLDYNNDKILRYIHMRQSYAKLVGLRYNGEYFYKQEGGILTAGQPDVRIGKSFIGWLGYPEVGTMQTESEE